MPSLMIFCPVTKEAVLTGVSIDEAAFAKSLPEDRQFVCPRCGETHTWSNGDAFFEQG